ncbi:hypothetical protein GGH12_001972 [Coemansia sp. RSA 1822]|nr:hypothetical protein GGH12_001972 [Coemansia sp. RSA 1822]
MRVHVLVPLALLFTLQRVAGSPRTVVIDDENDVDAMFAWETNQQYASESPWPSDEVSSYFSMAPSMNYPAGMADKETSRASSDDSGLFVLSETVDEPSATHESISDRLVETETVFVTLSGADDINESLVVSVGLGAVGAGGSEATLGFQSNGSFGGSSGGDSAGSVGVDMKNGHEAAQQVGHSTIVQTVMTASMDIVRVIGPSYTSTISMHMQAYESGLPKGSGYDMITPAVPTSSAIMPNVMQTPMQSAMPISMPSYEPIAPYNGVVQNGNSGGNSYDGNVQNGFAGGYSYNGGTQGGFNAGGQQGAGNPIVGMR